VAGIQGTQADRITALRADFSDARAMMVEHGEWTLEQALQIGLGIAEAINANDTGMLAFWCDWFALRGEAARALRLVGGAVLSNLRRAA
jgi:hypothetical protein